MASLADVSRSIMRTARAAPRLDVEQERVLLQRLQGSDDTGALDQLAASNLRRVISAANRLRGYGLPLDDLVQQGCCGMVLAARRFDTTRSVPFGAYAHLWVKAEMQDFILRNKSIVRLASGSVEEKLFLRLRQLEARLSRDPDVSRTEVTAEIARMFGVEVTQVEVIRARLAAGDLSLNAPAFNDPDGDSGSEFGDFLIEEVGSPDDMIEDDQCAADLRFAMHELDDSERLVIEERWLADDVAPLDALAEFIGVSKVKLRKIEIGAIDKLRRTMFARRARPNPVYA